MRKFDEDKSARVRLRKLKENCVAYEIETEKEFVPESKEWAVTTKLTVFIEGGFKKVVTGYGAMSTMDRDFGWAALPYAETTSLGRAISKTGLIPDDDIATDLEKEVGEYKSKTKESAPIRPKEEVAQFLNEALTKATKATTKVSIEQELSAPDEDVSEPPKEESESVEGVSEPVHPDLKYTEKGLSPMLVGDIESIYADLVESATNIPLEDIPVKLTKRKIIDFILWFQEGVFLENLKGVISGHMSDNVSKGYAPDIDVPSYLIQKLDIGIGEDEKEREPDKPLYHPKAVSLVEKYLAANQRNFGYVKVALLSPCEKEGLSIGDMTSVFDRFRRSGTIKFIRLTDFLKEGDADEMKLYFTELFKSTGR